MREGRARRKAAIKIPSVIASIGGSVSVTPPCSATHPDTDPVIHNQPKPRAEKECKARTSYANTRTP